MTLPVLKIKMPDISYRYEQKYADIISSMINKYHSKQMINLEDQLAFNEQEQLLKRHYASTEYENKIQALSEYYKFHFQAPRLFMTGIAEVVENYVSDKRDLEYNKVTEMIQKKNTTTKSSISNNNIKRLLQNIEISYVDFEKKSNKTKGMDKKVSFKQNKPLTIHHNVVKKKPITHNPYQHNKLTKQPSINNLIRTTSKRQLKLDTKSVTKILHNEDKHILGVRQLSKPKFKLQAPVRNIDLKMQRQPSKGLLCKTKSSMNLKSCIFKHVQSNKNLTKHIKIKSNLDNKEELKPLTSRKTSINETSKFQKQNVQFSNRFRSSVENLLFKNKKLR